MPITAPARVSSGAVSCSPSGAGRARPKSSSFTPCGVRNTFDGLRSRWIDAARVQRRERVQHAEPDRHGLGDAHRALLQALRQRRALEQLHGDEQVALVFADFVDLADVRMVDAGRRARLAPEALARRLVLRQRRHRLQRDRAMELLVARGIDDAHPALAELALDRVVAVARGQPIAAVATSRGTGRLGSGRWADQPVEERAQRH